jgi:hypothetical protein
MRAKRSYTRPHRALPNASPAHIPSPEPVPSPGVPPTTGSAGMCSSLDAYYTVHDSDRLGLDRHALQQS